jgi:hypothetical protein
MTDLSGLGRILLLIGLLIAAVGVLLLIFGRMPFLGRLPGDVVVQRGNWSFYFPLATSIIISLILTLVLNLFFFRR